MNEQALQGECDPRRIFRQFSPLFGTAQTILIGGLVQFLCSNTQLTENIVLQPPNFGERHLRFIGRPGTLLSCELLATER